MKKEFINEETGEYYEHIIIDCPDDEEIILDEETSRKVFILAEEWNVDVGEVINRCIAAYAKELGYTFEKE